MPRFFAKKTTCAQGHTHDSKAEAARCHDLHVMFRDGEIDAITVHPVIEICIGGEPVKMGNGQTMKFTPDFAYKKCGNIIYEDVKPKNGYMSRDVPVKLALLKHLGYDIRIVK